MPQPASFAANCGSKMALQLSTVSVPSALRTSAGLYAIPVVPQV